MIKPKDIPDYMMNIPDIFPAILQEEDVRRLSDLVYSGEVLVVGDRFHVFPFYLTKDELHDFSFLRIYDLSFIYKDMGVTYNHEERKRGSVWGKIGTEVRGMIYQSNGHIGDLRFGRYEHQKQPRSYSWDKDGQIETVFLFENSFWEFYKLLDTEEDREFALQEILPNVYPC